MSKSCENSKKSLTYKPSPAILEYFLIIHYGGKKINTANFERDLFHSHFFHANHSEQKHKMRKWLDSHVVCQIVTLKDVGFSYTENQKKLNPKSRNIVITAYKRYQKTQQYQPNKPTGRPRKLSKKDEKKLVSLYPEKPQINFATCEG